MPRIFLLLAWIASILALPALAAQRADRPEPTGVDYAAEERRLAARMVREGTNAAALFLLGEACHDAGVEGDKAAVMRADAYLRKALEFEPTNAPAMALLGSVQTLRGRDAFWPTTQIRLVHEGNKVMDRAVALAPDDIRTRLIRALNNAHMPDFLGRTEVVRADLAWLWEKIEKEPAHFTTSQKQEVALHLGRQLKRQNRPDRAREVWERATSWEPDSRHAGAMKVELKKLP